MQTSQTTRGVGGESAVNIQKFIANVNFPASKQDLLEAAERNEAPQEVIDAISSLNQGNFSSPQDVVRGSGINERTATTNRSNQ